MCTVKNHLFFPRFQQAFWIPREKKIYGFELSRLLASIKKNTNSNWKCHYLYKKFKLIFFFQPKIVAIYKKRKTNLLCINGVCNRNKTNIHCSITTFHHLLITVYCTNRSEFRKFVLKWKLQNLRSDTEIKCLKFWFYRVNPWNCVYIVAFETHF